MAFDQENALLFAQPIYYDWVYQSHDISIVPFEDNQMLKVKLWRVLYVSDILLD